MDLNVVLQTAKAWVALAGGIVTAVLAALPDDPEWLIALSAGLTAFLVWAVPNAPKSDPVTEDGDPDEPLEGDYFDGDPAVGDVQLDGDQDA